MPTYKYPRPALTVDIVVFGVSDDPAYSSLRVLLIERKHAPFKGLSALPGGFVNMNETIDKAAYRELREETSIKPSYLEQLYTFGDPKRDPRERVVSVAYYALVRSTDHQISAGSDAARVTWHEIDRVPQLAFDHKLILSTAIQRLRAKIRYAPIGFDLMPKTFTIGQIRQLYETLLGRKIDGGNFHRAIKKLQILDETGEQQEGNHRPAALYSFNRERYDDLVERGFNFEL